jgi:hypothetical protein
MHAAFCLGPPRSQRHTRPHGRVPASTRDVRIRTFTPLPYYSSYPSSKWTYQWVIHTAKSHSREQQLSRINLSCKDFSLSPLARQRKGNQEMTMPPRQMPSIVYGTAWQVGALPAPPGVAERRPPSNSCLKADEPYRKKERTTALVTQAIKAGFRGIDTACQPKVGRSLHRECGTWIWADRL